MSNALTTQEIQKILDLPLERKKELHQLLLKTLRDEERKINTRNSKEPKIEPGVRAVTGSSRQSKKSTWYFKRKGNGEWQITEVK